MNFQARGAHLSSSFRGATIKTLSRVLVEKLKNHALLCELIISLGCDIVLVAVACHMFFGSRTKRLDTEEFLALLLLLWSTSQNHIGQPVAENKLQKYHSPVARLVGVPEH